MTLGTTLLSLVRSRVVAQLERCGCPLLYTLVYLNFSFFPKKLKNYYRPVCPGVKFSGFSVKTEIIASLGTTREQALTPAPHYGIRLLVYSDNHSALFPLVDSRQLLLTRYKVLLVVVSGEKKQKIRIEI